MDLHREELLQILNHHLLVGVGHSFQVVLFPLDRRQISDMGNAEMFLFRLALFECYEETFVLPCEYSVDRINQGHPRALEVRYLNWLGGPLFLVVPGLAQSLPPPDPTE